MSLNGKTLHQKHAATQRGGITEKRREQAEQLVFRDDGRRLVG